MLIHPRTKPRIPWANERGSTRELAQGESRAWRVSIADIGRPAPFSALPGTDRILVVAAGEALLRIDGEESRLTVGESVAFPGEAEVSAVSLGDTALFLNLMMVRGQAEFDSRSLPPADEFAVPDRHDDVIVLLARGITSDGIEVEPGTLLMRATPGTPGAESSSTPVRLREPVRAHRFTRRR